MNPKFFSASSSWKRICEILENFRNNFRVNTIYPEQNLDDCILVILIKQNDELSPRLISYNFNRSINNVGCPECFKKENYQHVSILRIISKIQEPLM